MSTTRNDIELLTNCLTGSTKSFEILVQRYQSLVCALTYGATGNVDKSEELAQETFLLAWKNLRQLKDLGKFKAWLCQITRRVIQSWLRAHKRETAGKTALLEKASLDSHAISPAEVAIRREQQAVVNQAIEIIPEQYRVPLILFYRENKSTREVAEIIGLKENTARQRISRARALLKDQVAAMVETSLAQSKPGKAFTTGVLASMAGLSMKGAATATAAHAVSAGMSAVSLKITGIAAGLLLVAGVTYMTVKPKLSGPTPPPQTQTQAVSIPSDETESAAVTPVENSGQADKLVEEAPQENLAALQKEGTDQSPPSPAPSTPYEFESKGILSGLITDIETGEPIVDATVRVCNRYIFEAQTDAHGFYSIDKIAQPGQYDIAIDCPPYIGIPWGENYPIIPLTKESHAVKHFQLARACMVEIQVVDVNGVGIKDAKVIATSPTDTRKKEVAYLGEKRSTDARGCILLGGFAPSQYEYLITVTHNGPYREREVKGKTISYHTYDYAPEKATVFCTDVNIVEQRTVVLKKGQDIHGYVAYADGVPATDIDVIARPTWWHSNWSVCGSPVNTDGTFVLKHITPGTFTISGRFADTRSLPVIQEARLPLDSNEPLFLQLEHKSPQSLATIRGTLLLQGEAQPRYVSVNAYSSKFGHSSCRVDQDVHGNIETEFILTRLEPGPYRLTFSGDAVKEMVLEEVHAPCSDLEVTLETKKTSTVQGTVLDAKTLEPISCFRVRVIKMVTLRGPGYVQKNQWVSFENEQGTFSVDTVGPGIYQAQILAEGYAPALSPEINTENPENTVILLTQGGSITGTVTNQQGELVAGAKVLALSLSGGATSSTQARFVSEEGAAVTTQGAFTLPHLPSGVETLKVTHPDYAPTLVETEEILEGQILDDLDIILTPGGTLEGWVYDDQGQPVAKEILYVQDAMGYGGSDSEIAGRLATAVTDVNGFYRMEHLPTEFCYVKRAQTWNRLGVVMRCVTPKDNEDMAFDFGGSPMISGVAMANGVPLNGTRLLLGAKVSPDYGTFKCVTETNDQGAFTFRGTVPGRFSIHYKKEKDWIRITDIDVPATNLDLGLIETETTQLAIHVKQPDTNPWKIIQLYLGLPSRKVSGPLHMSERPTEVGEPWIISNIEPGQYALVLTRSDNVKLYQDVVLEPDQSQWEVSVDLSKQTGSLSGILKPDQIFVAWQDTPKMLVTIQADEQGKILHEHLPVGSYCVGTMVQWLYDMTPLTEFDLSANQDKHLDLNQFTLPNEELATLAVQVVGQNGDTPQDTELWLSCRLGELEPYMSSAAGTTFVAAAGDHILHIVSPSHKPVTRPIHLDPMKMGSAPDKVMIELEAQ